MGYLKGKIANNGHWWRYSGQFGSVEMNGLSQGKDSKQRALVEIFIDW